MSFNLVIPNKNTVIGQLDGNNVYLYNIQEGNNFTADDNTFKDSIGIHIEQVTIKSNGKWQKTVNITKEQGLSLLVSYFKKNIYPQFHTEMPDLPMSDAFGYFVCKALPSNNKHWNQWHWYANATALIDKGTFN